MIEMERCGEGSRQNRGRWRWKGERKGRGMIGVGEREHGSEDTGREEVREGMIWGEGAGRGTGDRRERRRRGKGPFNCYVMQMGVGGVIFSGKKRYEDVRFNVISITRGWVGVQFPAKKRYVTFEWPRRSGRREISANGMEERRKEGTSGEKGARILEQQKIGRWGKRGRQRRGRRQRDQREMVWME